MAYMDGKAATKQQPKLGVKVAPAPSPASAQSRDQGQSAKFRTYSFAPGAGVEVGNQVRVVADSHGLGVAGRPSTIAVAGRNRSMPAVENPSGARNEPGKY